MSIDILCRRGGLMPHPHARFGALPRLRDRYGPTALVTGASDGIGRAFAHHLAEAGFDLILVARGEAALAELAHELHSRHAIDAQVLAADLSDGAHVRLVAEATAGRDVGLLVAAAGFGTSGPFIDGELA